MFYANGESISGDDALQLFNNLWNIPTNWVEEPNIRRKGSSGVLRATFHNELVYIKKQVNHLHRNLRYPFGRPTALREAEALEAMRKLGVTVPDTVFCATRRVAEEQHTLLVTRALGNFLPLDQFISQSPALSTQEHRHLIRNLAAMLAKVHRNRWQHSCLYPKHIMIARKNDVFETALIDLEKMRRRLFVRQASRHDLDQLSRHQHCWDQKLWREFLEQYRCSGGT